MQNKGFWYYLKNTLYYVFIGLLIFIIAVSLFIPQGLVKVAGFGWYRVVSDSMEPVIMVDDYIVVVRKNDPENLVEGDIIVFETWFWHNNAYSKDVVTHHFGGFTEEGYILTYPHSQHDKEDKIYDEWKKGPGQIYNLTVDDLLGVHVLTIKSNQFIGFVTFLFTTPIGLTIVAINFGVFIAIYYLVKSMKAENKKLENESQNKASVDEQEVQTQESEKEQIEDLESEEVEENKEDN
ncbi:S24 family peptidase [Acholeplasma equirhinis]|uniref:S24/S26 family peptidase n=1 Tax=Acholeplasma equirhinis TaxID=555393 RepID=UPI00197ADFB5|nr:S24/S26 family peptidase [Acholeplasma equirhinis]MBN3491194.1 S24 family peptidase [Acholeplasma equirhinis]